MNMISHRTSLMSSAAGIALATCLIGAPSPASADINLGGYGGPVTIKFADYESIWNPTLNNGAGGVTSTAAVGDDLFGIVQIRSITANDGSGKLLWSPAIPGDGNLNGVFVGPVINGITPSGTGFSFTSKTPWHFDIYSNAAGVNAAQGLGGYPAGGCSLNTLCYNGVTNGGSILQLDILTTHGISPDPSVISVGTVTALTTPASGANTYDANAVGGAAFAQFHTLGVPTDFANTDFFINSDFCTQGAVNCNGGVKIGDWTFSSQDPVNGNVIPEPGSLGMLGSMLIALGAALTWRSRRRRDLTTGRAAT